LKFKGNGEIERELRNIPRDRLKERDKESKQERKLEGRRKKEKK
jgi:hypothetical protein